MGEMQNDHYAIEMQIKFLLTYSFLSCLCNYLLEELCKKNRPIKESYHKVCRQFWFYIIFAVKTVYCGMMYLICSCPSSSELSNHEKYH